MLSWLPVSRIARVALAAAAIIVGLLVLLLMRLEAGPLHLQFLDRVVARSVQALVPELTAEVGRAEVARSGIGIVLRVAELRLARDGVPILMLPALAVRPRLRALLRGRFEVGSVTLADVRVALTRTEGGEVWVGTDAAGAGGVALATLLAPRPEGASGAELPGLTLRRATVIVDDRAAGMALELAESELSVAPSAETLEVSVSARLRLRREAAPVRGTVTIPFRARVAAARLPGGGFGDATFKLDAENGALTPASSDTQGAEPIALGWLEAEGTYHASAATVRLEWLAALVETARLDAKATMILGSAPLLALDGSIDTLPLASLTRLWPADLARPARAWVSERLRDGQVHGCRVQLALKGADEGRTEFDIGCDFDGVTADYLPPLEPLRAAAGSARLTPGRLDVIVTGGEVGACRVEGGALAMDLDPDPPRATITADVSGTTADVATLVDEPPLEIGKNIGIPPSAVGGTSRVHAELTMPVRSDLRAGDIAVKATAQLADASVTLANGLGIREGTLAVTLAEKGVDIAGTTALVGVPAVTAPVQVDLDLKLGSDGAGHARVALDGTGVELRGTARMAKQAVTTATVERLRLAHHDLAGTLERRADGSYRARLTGPSLDLESLLAATGDGESPMKAVLAGRGTIELDLGYVRASPELELRNVRGKVEAADGTLAAFDVSGTLAPSGTVRATLAGGEARRRLTVTSDQAGRLLRAVTGRPEIEGGTLTLTATTDTRGPASMLDGDLAVEDFKVVNAPLLAHMLGIGSLGGMAALLQNEGLPMKGARLPFRWDGDRLTVRDARAIGTIGITADGMIDRAKGRCDVRGNVIPAYTLNSALGKVPILGRILIGKNEGIFGIAYQVEGSLPDPDVRVNPLTAVAPGVLRTWFVDPFTSGGRRPTAPSRRSR